MRYNDPLHVPSTRLVIWHNGHGIIMLNRRLLDRQNCWENLDEIKELHSERLHLRDMMEDTEDDDFLLLCNEYYTLIEYELQVLWKFPQDSNFHKFWNRPKCICPSLDSEDSYPSGHYVVNQECKLHGIGK